MSSAKKDPSGAFGGIALHLGSKKAMIVGNTFQLSPNGVTFKSDAALPAWTEVDMELQLPARKIASANANKIGCRGVVVHCKKQNKSGVYDVALLFCDVPPSTQQKLRAVSRKLSPAL
jgi:hypothetical protein